MGIIEFSSETLENIWKKKLRIALLQSTSTKEKLWCYQEIQGEEEQKSLNRHKDTQWIKDKICIAFYRLKMHFHVHCCSDWRLLHHIRKLRQGKTCPPIGIVPVVTS